MCGFSPQIKNLQVNSKYSQYGCLCLGVPVMDRRKKNWSWGPTELFWMKTFCFGCEMKIQTVFSVWCFQGLNLKFSCGAQMLEKRKQIKIPERTKFCSVWHSAVELSWKRESSSVSEDVSEYLCPRVKAGRWGMFVDSQRQHESSWSSQKNLESWIESDPRMDQNQHPMFRFWSHNGQTSSCFTQTLNLQVKFCRKDSTWRLEATCFQLQIWWPFLQHQQLVFWNSETRTRPEPPFSGI